MILSPVVSFENEKFTLQIRNKTVNAVSFKDTKEVLGSVEIHPEWLFADCSFEGADFGEQGMPEAIKPYVKNGFDEVEEVVAETDENNEPEQDYDIPEE